MYYREGDTIVADLGNGWTTGCGSPDGRPDPAICGQVYDTEYWLPFWPYYVWRPTVYLCDDCLGLQTAYRSYLDS